MKHLLSLSYLGTNYHGFQVQPNGDTVQAALGRAAGRLFCVPCAITGCSRTDSGVHANEYLAVLEEHSASSIPDEVIPRALNTYLSKDISVFRSVVVADDFSLRRHIAGKEYQYLIWNGEYRNPFYTDRALYYPRKIDLDLIQSVLPHFLGTHDFRAFMASGSDILDTVRTITDIRVERDGDFVKIFVAADGFLYNMVRIIVGTLLEVSEGKIAASAVPSVIAGGNRDCAGRTAPPEGLYLNRVFLTADTGIGENVDE